MEAYAIKLTTILIIVIYIGIHNVLESHYRRNYHYMRMKALLYHNQIATQNGRGKSQNKKGKGWFLIVRRKTVNSLLYIIIYLHVATFWRYLMTFL